MAENSLLISVVIPMYNAADSIVRALDSIRNQSYTCDYEILVVNDGSKDNSLRVAQEYADKYSNDNFKIIIIDQPNGGVSKARNAGLQRAKGEYIAFLDSDDYWVLNKIELQVKCFKKYTDADFLCGLRNTEKVSFPYICYNGIARITTKKLLFKVVGQTSTAIMKSRVRANTGYFDESQKYSEDANYWLKISLKNIMLLQDITLVKTDNEYGQNGLSSNISGMYKGVVKNIKEIYEKGKINLFEYLFFRLFSFIKYLRRIYL